MRLKTEYGFDGIRHLMFDLGNVLVDLDVSRSLDAFRRLGMHGLKLVDLHPDLSGFFLRYELGEISTGEFTRRAAELCGPIPPSCDSVLSAWNAMLLDPEPERFYLMEKLKDHYRIYVLSNTNPAHIAHLRYGVRQATGRNFEDLFDRCFYSHELRLRKPDPAVYRKVAQLARIHPGETLFIDDNPGNCAGARTEGFHTIHLTEKGGIFNLFE